jgi:predicted DNA-binding transcriptional regulator AlpA
MSRSVLIPYIGLRLLEAANYVGLKPMKFQQLMEDSRMPKPIKIDRCTVWDVRKFIACFDKLQEVPSELSDDNTPSQNSNLKQWKDIGHVN